MTATGAISSVPAQLWNIARRLRNIFTFDSKSIIIEK